MPDNFTYDVFLSHNSADKPVVRELATILKERGLRPWLDEWELRPGEPWQEAIEDIIQTIRTAAVCFGEAGLGPWEEPEMRACLSQFVRRKLRVIPVLLPGAPKVPDLPLFLSEFTWVDMREGLTDKAMELLVWGITGEKPDAGEEEVKTNKGAPRIHNLPYRSIENLFMGRGEELERLHEQLKKGKNVVVTQALVGMGGIGKTRLAVEYGWRFGAEYSAVFFVVADTHANLYANLAKLGGPRIPGSGGVLDLEGWEGQTQAAQLALVFNCLANEENWLLILDNVDTDEAAIEVEKKIMPSLSGGSVLITSRRRRWPKTIKRDTLERMSLDDSTAYLIEAASERRNEENDQEQALELAKLMHALPLALEQAAAYINEERISFAQYIGEWQEEAKRLKLLDFVDKQFMEHEQSVAVTFTKSWERLEAAPRAILRICAYLAPDPIPEALFADHPERVAEAVKLLLEELPEADAQTMTPQKAIGRIEGYSLATIEDDAFVLHRIVQEVLRLSVPEARRSDWIQKALDIINDHTPFDADDVRTWAVCEALRPHIEEIVARADKAEITEPTARLMNQAALFLEAKALYSQAEPLYRRALEIDEAVRGAEDPTVATRLNNLAQLLQATNRLDEAEPLMRRALQIDEAAFGTDHPDVARDLNNLASLLLATNRLEEAEPLMRRALQIDETSFGTDHPNVAIRLNNLASLLLDTNRLEEAEPIMRKALQIDETAFGPEHPNVGIRLNNLAQLLLATNRCDEAERMMRRALEIDETAFGPDHPNVAIRLNNLAQLLKDTNRLGEAETMMSRALQIDEASYGPEHPSVAIRLGNLGSLLQAQGKPEEGKKLLERALAILEKSFDADHPYVIEAKRRLASFE